MSHVKKPIKTWNRGYRGMAARHLGFFEVTGMCGIIAAWSKADAGFVRSTWTERDRQRRPIHSAESNGYSRLDKPRQSSRCNPRVAGTWAIGSDPARFKAGLLPVCGNAVPVELRLGEAGYSAWELPRHGLYGEGGGACKTADRNKPVPLATCQKNANGSPATERTKRQTFRHGTNQSNQNEEIGDFVPARNKTPCFSGWLRSAKGHLSRITICSSISEKRNGQ